MKRISVMLSLMLGVAQVLMGASNALSDGKAIVAGPDGKLVVEITIEPSIGKPMYTITYDGKTVHFKGMVAHNRQLPADAFVIGRDVMTCCVEDITFAGMVAQWQGAIALGQKDWVTVVAEIRMQEHKLYGRRGPVLKITKLEKAVPPDQPVATFY